MKINAEVNANVNAKVDEKINEKTNERINGFNDIRLLNDLVLTGDKVQLIPMAFDYQDELVNAAADGELWKLWFTGVPDKDSITRYIESAMSQKEAGQSLPFIVRDLASNKIVGSTRFCNIATADRRLEIGYTWYSKSAQRTSINTECKYLLLSYAFEQLHAIAVEFRTHWHNQASRAAIARLGAKQDGVLRNHKIMPDGTYRDTVVFSIVEHEWPAVKNALEFKLQQSRY